MHGGLAAGDLGTLTDLRGHTTTRTYDAVSRLATQTDLVGRTTQFVYDALNRLTTTIDSLGRRTGFTCGNGNRTSAVDRVRGLVTGRQEKGRKDRVVPLGERALAWLDKSL